MAELADLLTGPVARSALAQRDVTAVYRLLCAAGVTQARIAQATGQKQSEVSAILAGRRVLSVTVLERIADGLGVPRGWMGLAYAPGLVPETEPDDTQTEGERGANLFRHGATVLFGAPIFSRAAPIRVESAPTPTPAPDRVGLTDVARVAATTERLGQLAGDLGGIPVTDALTAHAQASEALLGATMGEPIRQQLLVAVSDAHSAAGGAAAGAGLCDLARQHYVRSMNCAGAAGDRLRIVVSVDSLGRMEVFDVPNEALKFFQLGAATAPTPLIRAKLEYDCAWALGLLGLAGEARSALRRARDTYEAARGELRPWKHFATALPYVEGRTQLALGRFDPAAVAFVAAVDGASHARGCSMDNFAQLAT
ncbi:MAG: helix-turn-helix domain-containing protein, partial [Pseudonocardiaceae bacterium]